MPDLSAKPNRNPPARSAALDALTERFRPPLLRYVRRRVGDASEADALVQEVFLRMLRRRQGAGLEETRGYLFETASRVLAERGRQLEVRPRTEPEEAAVLQRPPAEPEHRGLRANLPALQRWQAAAAAIAVACMIALALFYYRR